MRPVQPAPFRNPGQAGHRPRPPVTLIEGVPTYAYPNGAVPGPRPPKSWSVLFSAEEKNEPAWRASALSLFLRDLPSSISHAECSTTEQTTIPPLTIHCIRILISLYDKLEDLGEIAQYISPHLRREIMRWCAIYRPMTNGKLYALCGNEGRADGELIVVGPEGTLRMEILKKANGTGSLSRSPAPEKGCDGEPSTPISQAALDWDEEVESEDWDVPWPAYAPPPLTALALLATPLSISALFSFPPTLTHLALLAIPQPAPVHRLPHLCPLLEVLDLSLNSWLGDPTESTLDRVEWKRWRQLRVLGLRECGVGPDIARIVNQSRWADVEVVGVVEARSPIMSTAAANNDHRPGT